MPVAVYAGCRVDVDEEGFLTDRLQWTPEIGEAVAAEIGLALTPTHWKVVTLCREEAAREGRPPDLRRITELSGVGTKQMHQLFPRSPAQLTARVAGLPNPAGCV